MSADQNTKCPFQPGTMVTTPEKFWGRMYEKTALITRINNMGSSVITGSRRIGKSSLAYFLYSHYKSNINYDSIWIDCQNINMKSVDGLFDQIKVNSSLNYTLGATKHECLKNFESTIKTSNKKIVLFIDEFELLTDSSHKEQFDESFYMHLRMLAGQGGNLALVLVSKEPLQEICKHTLGISSPFYNIFSSIPLSLFSENEIQAILKSQHDGFKFSSKEIKFIRGFEDIRHPLVAQVVCEAIFVNRHVKEKGNLLKKKIENQIGNYLNHDEVQRERKKEKEMAKKKEEPAQISKPLDLLFSILIPIAGIGLIIFEFGWLIQRLNNFQSVVLAIFSAIVGFAVLIFAGRSINIIGETTFFKLFVRIIEQIPLFSNILNTITNITKNIRK